MKHHQFLNDIFLKNIIEKRKTVSIPLNNLINSQKRKNSLIQKIRALCSDYFFSVGKIKMKCPPGKSLLVILLPDK